MALEEWMNWNFDEYDLESRKIPWFETRKERRWVGNISYMSILANALGNMVVSARNLFVRLAAQAVTAPVSAYYRFRLRNKMYRFVPELEAVRLLRERIFYRSTYTFK